ncbi:hypothetical protein TrCOL_g12748 [Triparma columacea]|uniref:Man(5)GlcNAc(2)-PP-dolichol translocation protein RFT1 n=1 Tax=Triparma columacea TaxID=722753 RepID=A0A9W7LDV8_9STRA|nr:hypothetical protein TrCOL_g12748 [Triparma columacea]
MTTTKTSATYLPPSFHSTLTESLELFRTTLNFTLQDTAFRTYSKTYSKNGDPRPNRTTTDILYLPFYLTASLTLLHLLYSLIFPSPLFLPVFLTLLSCVLESINYPNLCALLLSDPSHKQACVSGSNAVRTICILLSLRYLTPGEGGYENLHAIGNLAQALSLLAACTAISGGPTLPPTPTRVISELLSRSSTFLHYLGNSLIQHVMTAADGVYLSSVSGTPEDITNYRKTERIGGIVVRVVLAPMVEQFKSKLVVTLGSSGSSSSSSSSSRFKKTSQVYSSYLRASLILATLVSTYVPPYLPLILPLILPTADSGLIKSMGNYAHYVSTLAVLGITETYLHILAPPSSLTVGHGGLARALGAAGFAATAAVKGGRGGGGGVVCAMTVQAIVRATYCWAWEAIESLELFRTTLNFTLQDTAFRTYSKTYSKTYKDGTYKDGDPRPNRTNSTTTDILYLPFYLTASLTLVHLLYSLIFPSPLFLPVFLNLLSCVLESINYPNLCFLLLSDPSHKQACVSGSNAVRTICILLSLRYLNPGEGGYENLHALGNLAQALSLLAACTAISGGPTLPPTPTRVISELLSRSSTFLHYLGNSLIQHVMTAADGVYLSSVSGTPEDITNYRKTERIGGIVVRVVLAPMVEQFKSKLVVTLGSSGSSSSSSSSSSSRFKKTRQVYSSYLRASLILATLVSTYVPPYLPLILPLILPTADLRLIKSMGNYAHYVSTLAVLGITETYLHILAPPSSLTVGHGGLARALGAAGFAATAGVKGGGGGVVCAMTVQAIVRATYCWAWEAIGRGGWGGGFNKAMITAGIAAGIVRTEGFGGGGTWGGFAKGAVMAGGWTAMVVRDIVKEKRTRGVK